MLWHTCEQSQSSTGMNVSQTQLAITKTSGKLGPNHYRNGAWDRLEGQDSINQASKQAKMQRQYNCCVPGCTNCSGAAFLLVLSLQMIPSAFALLILTQVPTELFR